jgi:colicin import membrane protein
MPNGEIKDIFFTDRSGNSYLDESAYKAIVKSNPVDPHPEGISKPYVNVGLRFTPEGVR